MQIKGSCNVFGIPYRHKLIYLFYDSGFFCFFPKICTSNIFRAFCFLFSPLISFLTSENGFLEKCSRQQNSEAVLYISLHPHQLILPCIRMIIKAIIIVVIIHFFFHGNLEELVRMDEALMLQKLDALGRSLFPISNRITTQLVF